MKAFEYAAPRHEADVVELLDSQWGTTELLAGGTDLVPLLKKMIVQPRRVVYLGDVQGLSEIQIDSQGARIGAMATLDTLLDEPALDDHRALKQAIRGINSMQLQAQGTLGGELCQRPNCWYFRNGHGLLADRGRLVELGDNRYHAIFGNSGVAKFVHPSRLAPALIALDAQVRYVGADEEETVQPLEFFYRVPRDEHERETVLQPNQLLTHITIPPAEGKQSGAYEVRQSEGPDAPLCAAAAAVRMEGGVVTEAKVVLGHVAPLPWVSNEATRAILGRPITPETALAAGEAAIANATPLSMNGYKVHLARTSVQRALLLAAGLETGGF